MFAPITIRFPKPMAREIDALVEKYADEGMDKSSVIRRLVKFGLTAEKRGEW